MFGVVARSEGIVVFFGTCRGGRYPRAEGKPRSQLQNLFYTHTGNQLYGRVEQSREINLKKMKKQPGSRWHRGSPTTGVYHLQKQNRFVEREAMGSKQGL